MHMEVYGHFLLNFFVQYVLRRYDIALHRSTTEDKEKAEVLNAFFTSVFKDQTAYPQGTPLSDLGVLAGEQTKPPLPLPRFRRTQSETYCSYWTASSPWGQMRFTREC